MRIFKLSIKVTKQPIPIPDSVWHNPWHFIAFGFGSGMAPILQGTAGTLAAIPFYLMMRDLSLGWYVGLVAVLTILATWLCHRVEQEIGVHDHPGMNLDEFIGYWVAMINAPLGWRWVVLGFVLFRIFDMWKPWPISWLDDNIGGGFGMIFDDVVAGLFALVIMHLLSMGYAWALLNAYL